MVGPIPSTGASPIDPRHGVNAKTTNSGACDTSPGPTAGTPAARLAALGPPIDLNRVGEIRAAIAQSRYNVDADRLAAAMIALDLPGSAR